MKVFIIIPCYNEAESLPLILRAARSYGRTVVVDDGSVDQSATVAEQNGAVVLSHLINRGQGAALATGNQYALLNDADIVVHFDADGQHQAAEIPLLIQPIVLGRAEVVLGSRFLKQNQTPWFKKYFILKPVIFFQNLLLGVKLTDAHNGFRAFSAAALAKIELKQDGMAHATEIIEQLILHKLKYQEIPVTITYHDFGQGFMAGLRILRDLLFGKINKN